MLLKSHILSKNPVYIVVIQYVRGLFMKRKFSIAAIISAILMCAVLGMSGCGKTQLSKYGENISELREHLFAAESAEYKITAISGVREDPYELNGVSGAKRDFTVITVTPAVFAPDKTYRYTATIGDSTFEGSLMPHPFAQSLSVDIPMAATEDFSVTVGCGEEQTFELKNSVPGDLISAEKAFGIALEKLKNEIKRFKTKNKLNAEIYVRLMENPIDGNGGYFWYVSFVGEDKTTVAVLLKGETGEVSAVRI